MNIKELLTKVLKDGSDGIDLTEEGIIKAAQEKGVSAKDIEEALRDFDDFPLEEKDLEIIVGGVARPPNDKGSGSML